MVVKGKLYGIGVGPGDPELITIKAGRILKKVSIIAVPKSSREKKSLALKIAEDIIGADTELMELDFPMSLDSKILNSSWEKAATLVAEKLDAGLDVGFITLGDPTVYSTYIYLHKLITEQGYEAEIIPGVTSFCASAARAGISLAEGNETIAVIPSAYDNKKLPQVIDNFENVVLMKAAKSIEEIGIILKNKALDKNVVIVNNCGLEDETLTYDIESEKIKEFGYFTTVILKKNGVR